MKSAVEILSPTRVRLTIDAPFADLEPHFAKAYKEIASKVSIPGFRKGKIPAALIDQRVGRAVVLDEAINIALPQLYISAAQEHDVRVLGRPEVDIKELVDNEKLSFTVEVDVRPKLELPNLDGIKLTVDAVEITDAEIDEQVESLRIRFGTLTAVEKKVENGDFVSLNLIARVNGEVVDGGTANNISYEVGKNNMIDGLDEALVGMKKDESRTFQAPLQGVSEGEIGEIDVKLVTVNRRDLPPLDDDFAKKASEFETLDELKADTRERLMRLKRLEQGAQARDKLVQFLLDTVEIAIPENLVSEGVHDHLEKEGRLEDEEHRSEVTAELNQSIKNDFLMDEIAKSEKVQVSEAELSEYIVRSASRYGMAPKDFANEVAKAGQISSLVAD
ncbi:MAG: trigger factor, partial [Actinobacteria bacterium]|nr:trigger factor [Actinomycetota bacterium]